MPRIIFLYETHYDSTTIDTIGKLSSSFKDANIKALGIEQGADQPPISTDALKKEQKEGIKIVEFLRANSADTDLQETIHKLLQEKGIIINTSGATDVSQIVDAFNYGLDFLLDKLKMEMRSDQNISFITEFCELDAFSFDMPGITTKSTREASEHAMILEREEHMLKNIKAKAESLESDEAVLVIVGADHHVIADSLKSEGMDVSEILLHKRTPSKNKDRHHSLINKVAEGKIAMVETTNTETLEKSIAHLKQFLVSPESISEKDISDFSVLSSGRFAEVTNTEEFGGHAAAAAASAHHEAELTGESIDAEEG